MYVLGSIRMVSTGNVLPEEANRLRMVFTGKLLTEEVIEQYNFTVGLIARRRRKKWVCMCTEYDFVKENESV